MPKAPVEDEPILDEIKRRLKALGSHTWEDHARRAGVAKTLPRKIVANDRNSRGPGVLTIQPLLTYLRSLPQTANPELG